MNRLLAIALTASLVSFAGSAMAASGSISIGTYGPGDAAGGIGQSRHNLGALGVYIKASDTSQICVFCHTPHHTAVPAHPLWNRSNTNAASYTAYGTTSAGTTIADGDLYGATLACLSCHDGVTTFDNLVNRPGKDTGSGDLGWTFTEDGTLASDFLTNGRLTIGPALSDDHPVSVPYTEGAASLRATNTNIYNINLASGLGSTDANVMQNLWAVKGYFNSDATINDLLRDNPNVTGGRAVECSSCHDPHFSNKSYDEVEWTWDGDSTDGTDGAGGEPDADGLFLRRVGGNAGSGVCRTCHNK
jgi:hypothetical protein